MIRVLFVCHGNICRSPMAEFVFRDMVLSAGLSDRISAASAATSTEEIGNPVHRGTRRMMQLHRIPMADHRAVQLDKNDYKVYDYLIGMDRWNLRNMERILGKDPAGKIWRLLDLTEERRDVADPWYTGDFEQTYRDVCLGCRALLKRICTEQGWQVELRWQK